MCEKKTCMFSLIVCSQSGECIIDGQSPVSGVRGTAKEVQRSRADRGSSYFSSGTVCEVSIYSLYSLFVFTLALNFRNLPHYRKYHTIPYHNALCLSPQNLA